MGLEDAVLVADAPPGLDITLKPKLLSVWQWGYKRAQTGTPDPMVF